MFTQANSVASGAVCGGRDDSRNRASHAGIRLWQQIRKHPFFVFVVIAALFVDLWVFYDSHIRLPDRRFRSLATRIIQDRGKVPLFVISPKDAKRGKVDLEAVYFAVSVLVEDSSTLDRYYPVFSPDIEGRSDGMGLCDKAKAVLRKYPRGRIAFLIPFLLENRSLALVFVCAELDSTGECHPEPSRTTISYMRLLERGKLIGEDASAVADLLSSCGGRS